MKSIYTNDILHARLQQQRPDIPRFLQQMHAQQIPPGAAMAHPGLPGLPGLGPAAGLPVPTSASAALLGLGLTGAAAATPGTTAAAHSLSMLVKPEIHRGQPDDLKSNGGKSIVLLISLICSRTIVPLYVVWLEITSLISQIHGFGNWEFLSYNL